MVAVALQYWGVLEIRWVDFVTLCIVDAGIVIQLDKMDSEHQIQRLLDVSAF